ncbi:SOH1-like protein [Ordospora pajunii]|uniref:SOH1-like protein n=1 Tax=Ordospora pajunii TaxID=3039483 RepID=UPI0029526712|nr:SOH1-like protein [Ordospora pajunii]KAH9410558.1 SOH1-like protein [Ordospora pajunii]
MASRFEKELEFVQLLCNPDYLRWLHTEGYFESSEFKQYLKYLEYWKSPGYSKFLVYPQCLVVLQYLNRSDVEDVFASGFLQHLGEQQHFIWLNKHKENWNRK